MMIYVDYLSDLLADPRFDREKIARMLRVVTINDFKCTIDDKCPCGKLLTYNVYDGVNCDATCNCGSSFKFTPFGVERLLR